MSKCLKIILLLYFQNFRFEMVKSEDVEKKILDETAGKPGQFPFLVKLLVGSGEFLCSGSIVHPKKVLTAAHCLVDKKAKFVVTGSADTKGKRQQRKITRCFLHPEFTRFNRIHKRRNRGNDLGIVEIDEDLELNDETDMIQLGGEIGMQGGIVAAGNGLEMHINEEMLSRKSGGSRKAKCVTDGRAHFSTYELKKTAISKDNSIIALRAKNPNKVICESDTGGPLLTEGPPYYLIGIQSVNHGTKSYESSTISEENRNWILSHLEDKSKISSRRNGQKGI